MTSFIYQPWVGHAGEMGGIGMMPHELMGGMVLLALLGLALVILGAVGIWLLFRIERHLRNKS